MLELEINSVFRNKIKIVLIFNTTFANVAHQKSASVGTPWFSYSGIRARLHV